MPTRWLRTAAAPGGLHRGGDRPELSIRDRWPRATGSQRPLMASLSIQQTAAAKSCTPASTRRGRAGCNA